MSLSLFLDFYSPSLYPSSSQSPRSLLLLLLLLTAPGTLFLSVCDSVFSFNVGGVCVYICVYMCVCVCVCVCVTSHDIEGEIKIAVGEQF